MPFSRSLLPFLLPALLLHHALQAQVAVGQWREHLPYTKGLRVAITPNRIYHVGQHGLYYMDRQSNSLERLSKVTGLSDFGFSSIDYSAEHNTVVIAYSNTNIDLIKDNEIINIPDIKIKQILGNKTINDIHIDGDYAYLACGFAVVVLDLLRQEIKDTWYIGEDGDPLMVNDISSNNEIMIAATARGLMWAPRNGLLLADYNNWAVVDGTYPGQFAVNYGAVTNMSGRFYASRDDGVNDTIFYQPTVGGAWAQFPDPNQYNVNNLESNDSVLMVCSDAKIQAYTSSHQNLVGATEYGPDRQARPKHGQMDETGMIWIADNDYGLCALHPSFSTQVFTLNGPGDISSFDIDVWNGQLYMASGGYNSAWNPQYINSGISSFIDGTWNTLRTGSGLLTNMWDLIRVKVDPNDSRKVYVCSWGAGLIELYDGVPTARYDTTNSSITAIEGYPGNYRLGGLALDNNGTLWLGGTDSGELLFARSAAGTWYSYRFPGVLTTGSLANMAIDDLGQIWSIVPRGAGLLVFNHNGSLSTTADDKSIKMTTAIGNGALASNNLFCIAADLDGEIWVGSDNGISVFYSPASVFGGGSFDSQQILIEQDGYVQYVLENQAVTAIKVDGANRKWVGTATAGIYLLSADGTKEIHHFTTQNSPLPSNNITAIGIDHLSGEVFIGTDKGLVSFRSDATYGEPEIVDEKVFAYPNPVKPDYFGPIAIKGLTRDADVKITDVSGRVVFATKAAGGQAVWDGNNLNGQSARSGVYLVFASNEDGEQTVVTKIMFVR